MEAAVPGVPDTVSELSPAGRLANVQSALVRLSRAIEGALRDGASGLDLTPAQAEVLRFAGVIRPDVATVGQLARVLGVRHTTVLGVLRPLVVRGLVERHPHPYDARQHTLALTATGHALLERLDGVETDIARVLDRLEEGEVEGLEIGLAGLARGFAETDALVVPAPCQGCVHFEEDAATSADAPHYCRLIRRHLTREEAVMPCPEHTEAVRRRGNDRGDAQ